MWEMIAQSPLKFNFSLEITIPEAISSPYCESGIREQIPHVWNAFYGNSSIVSYY
jgi:hypothetical protein